MNASPHPLVELDAEKVNRVSSLTVKERQCLELVGQRLSSKEIAHRLGIAKSSVDTYCDRARAKLAVDDRFEAALYLLSDPAVSAARPARFEPKRFRGRDTLIAISMLIIAIAMIVLALNSLEALKPPHYD